MKKLFTLANKFQRMLKLADDEETPPMLPEAEVEPATERPAEFEEEEEAGEETQRQPVPERWKEEVLSVLKPMVVTRGTIYDAYQIVTGLNLGTMDPSSADYSRQNLTRVQNELYAILEKIDNENVDLIKIVEPKREEK